MPPCYGPCKQLGNVIINFVRSIRATVVRDFLERFNNLAPSDFDNRLWPPTFDQLTPNRGLDFPSRSQLSHMARNEFLGHARERIGPALRCRAPLSRFLFLWIDTSFNVAQGLQRGFSGLCERHDWILTDHPAHEFPVQSTQDDKC
jgi:hypothetical protein